MGGGKCLVLSLRFITSGKVCLERAFEWKEMETEFNRKLTLLFCIFRQPDVRRLREREREKNRKWYLCIVKQLQNTEHQMNRSTFSIRS